MIGRLVEWTRQRVGAFWELDDPDERIEGTGEVHLDPAYNGRYTAERRLQQLSSAQNEVMDEAPDSESPPPGLHEP